MDTQEVSIDLFMEDVRQVCIVDADGQFYLEEGALVVESNCETGGGSLEFRLFGVELLEMVFGPHIDFLWAIFGLLRAPVVERLPFLFHLSKYKIDIN